ncbi:hypothetical protein MVES_000480 [Malassezia vespertilionis]|uniref:Glycosyltransferase subfamily 4-like N-terminal domain-containing protein n=1 Tax=Malassezia vespertilionis TaxID=2020962 RepID=A0A2N1JGD0_9BASI|nr:hypothetical protein MVES_000480 [Malassezia vespertilionis]
MMSFENDAALQAVSYPYAQDRKRRKIRVAIVTEHLNLEGHEALVLGPDTPLTEYSGHPVVGTFGIPLIVYPGLKLNFMRLRFLRRIQQFQPDVVHFVDPIWLGAQMMYAVRHILPDVPFVSSYHTNLPTYASLFGLPFLENTMWKLTRALHDQCELVFCPSQSTRRMLEGKGFSNVEIWGRGVDTDLFTPGMRDENLRASWGCKPKSSALLNTLHTQAAHRAKQIAITDASPEAEAFIRTPESLPTVSPILSPPPSYESLSDLPPLPGFTLPPALLPQGHNPVTDGESKAVILYVGRISWEKNIRLLVESFRLLPAAVRNNSKLVIVGDGPARADLTRLCAKYKLDAAFMGQQKGKRLASMFASSSIFAFPSFTETFGQVVLEALASGLPVVGLHAEGISDLVCHGTTGLLLDVKRVMSQQSSAAGSGAANERVSAKGNKVFSSPVSPKTQQCASNKACAIAAGSNVKPGLASPIPTVKEFAAAMSAGSRSFQQCAQVYSILLERLIRDRTLRAMMGQRAQQFAVNRTWWDAMESPVRGYEHVVSHVGKPNLTDHELEALRNQQRKIAPLTGPIVKMVIVAYLVFFLYLWTVLF